MQYKSPDEKYDYVVNWTTTLSGSTITASVWTVPAPLANEAASNDAQTTTLKVSGGLVGVTYRLVNEITANNGDVFKGDFYLRVKRKHLG